MGEQRRTDPMIVATRAWAPPTDWKRRKPRKAKNNFPPVVLVPDWETTGDETQATQFGAYRVYAHRDVLVRCGELPAWKRAIASEWAKVPEWVLVEEGLIHAEGVDERQRQTLIDYCENNLSDAPSRYGVRRKRLRLRTRREFLAEVFYPLAYQAKALVLGFNLPFDISRTAFDAREARGRDTGGFSYVMADYTTGDGATDENSYQPRIVVKTINNKKSLIKFAGARRNELAPRGRGKGQGPFRGHFLDVRTLAFALSNRGHSLKSLGRTLDIAHPKQDLEPDKLGVVKPETIDYCRRDVLATWECFLKLRDEYRRHPIPLPATKAYSPASIAKGYLNAMKVGVPELAPDHGLGLSEDAVYGACMEAYYGGWTECRVRLTPVPVVYTDFVSMYPTVNTLMGLWELLTAKRVRVVDATDEVQAFLARVSCDDLFRPATWRQLPVVAWVLPDGDILPVRARYGKTNDWQNSLNPYTADRAQCYALADVVAAKLRTGKVPTVVRAIRFVPEGRQRGLRPVKLRGEIAVDPRTDDFFKTVIELRKSLPDAVRSEERAALDQLLKTFANAGSYGIFVEQNRQDGTRAECTVWTGADEPFTVSVEHPEEPGAFAFPPLGTLIPAAARLMLALLERCVTDLGGTYAFCDTDSMAIVATETGGLIPCPGGPGRMADGRPAIRALTWEQVRAMVRQFEALNPYDPEKVRGSVLKIEDVNYAECGIPGHDQDEDGRPKRCICTKVQRRIDAVSISAKRYALYTLSEQGEPVVVDARAHGLGHLLAPDEDATIAPDGVDEEEGGSKTKPWHRDVWEKIICERLSLPAKPLPWLDDMAVGRITVSKPEVWRAFAEFNRGKPYQQQIKPGNFLLTAQLDMPGLQLGKDAERFRLIAPFEKDAKKRKRVRWRNLYDDSGKTYRVTTDSEDARPGTMKVTTYRDVVDEYTWHPEAKSGDAQGNPCGRQTVGLLHRRHVRAVGRRFIGKESNKLEEVEEGLIGDADDVYIEYRRPGEELAALRRALAVLPTNDIARSVGMSPFRLREIRDGRATPHERTRVALERAVHEGLRGQLQILDALPPDARSLPLDALNAEYADVLTAVRDFCAQALRDLVAEIGQRQAARRLGLRDRTLRRWARDGVPADAPTLAGLRIALTPTQALT